MFISVFMCLSKSSLPLHIFIYICIYIYMKWKGRFGLTHKHRDKHTPSNG